MKSSVSDNSGLLLFSLSRIIEIEPQQRDNIDCLSHHCINILLTGTNTE